MNDTEKAALCARIDELCAENERLRGTISEINQLAVMSANVTRETQDRLQAENVKLRGLARWASMLLTGIMPYVDYSRCTALEAVAAWKVKASELGVGVDE